MKDKKKPWYLFWLIAAAIWLTTFFLNFNARGQSWFVWFQLGNAVLSLFACMASWYRYQKK